MKLFVVENNHNIRTRGGAIIELTGVSRHYGSDSQIVRAVDGIDLRVDAGDFVSVTGNSGAGKSTLLALIGGLTNATAGEVRVLGKLLSGLDDREISTLRGDRIGFVFQFQSLLPSLTALDNVRLPGLFSKGVVEINEAKDLLSRVGLSHKSGSYPSQLSGGEQARVALARALANKPVLLLADEPTGNLDVDTEKEILSYLREINLEMGTSILLVTHSSELSQYGNRHLVMKAGRLL